MATIISTGKPQTRNNWSTRYSIMDSVQWETLALVASGEIAVHETIAIANDW